MQAPLVVLNSKIERETGRKAQMSNIIAAKTVSDIIRSCLGPCAMLKMLLDPMGGIVLTNDGNSILREIEVSHPAAKSMIELSRTQDEEVGDGTTSVIVLAGEILGSTIQHLERNIHPINIISALKKALDRSIAILDSISKPINVNDEKEMLEVIKNTLNTKFVSRWNDMMCQLALKAVKMVKLDDQDNTGKINEIDIKKYVRIEKIPGESIESSKVIDGILINKDVTHPNMRRYIENPRILLLDCPLEYKKGESQTNIEIQNEEDWNKILQIEEEQIRAMCNEIIKLKPDLVFTEKGVSDLAQHFLMKANITAIRRLRKTDNNRIARAVGATIVNQVDDLKEEDIGTQCGEFKVEKIGDEYYTFLSKCKDPKACTVLLRGPSKDVLNEVDRNLQDAMHATRNVFYLPKLVPGGGASEMAISVGLSKFARETDSIEHWPLQGCASSFEVIPRTLALNCGAKPIKIITELKSKHNEDKFTYGINGTTGEIVDMLEHGVWEPLAVKLQTIKTAIESSCLLLRVDDIVSGIGKKADKQAAPSNNME